MQPGELRPGLRERDGAPDMNSAQQTLDFGDNASRAVHGTVAPLVRPAGPQESTYLRYIWECPSCGGRTVSMCDQNETREAIEADPLCYRCRRPNSVLCLTQARIGTKEDNR